MTSQHYNFKDQTDSECTFENHNGQYLRIQNVRNLGWLLEFSPRANISPTMRQQDELAVGYQLPTSTLAVDVGSDKTNVSSGTHTLSISSTGELLLAVEGVPVFRSAEEPFSMASEPVLEREGMSSRYFRDLLNTKPPSWIKHIVPDGRFETMKVKLKINRPSGPILGLPGCTGEFDRSGYRFELYNSDNGLHDPSRRPLYQSWPIVFFCAEEGGGWCGIFWDNPSRTFIDCGDFDPDLITFESSWGHGRLLLVTGETLEEAAHLVHRFVGQSLFPPQWAFGYHQSRWSYMSTAEVRNVVNEFRSRQIPLDAVHFDIDYMKDFQVFTSNPESFADFPDCVRELKDAGVASVAIVDPGIQINEEYCVYRELRDKYKSFREPDGSPFVIKAWPGDCILPDFTDEETSAWWSATQRRWLLDTGVAGVWNDMNEPTNWDGKNQRNVQALCSRGAWAPDYNLYGYLMARASSRGKLENDQRPLVITRSGYPGAHQFSIIWHGDNHSWWEHLRLALQTALGYSLCGAIFTGPDIPGFEQHAPDDLAIRFFQLGAFLPFFRGHSSIFSEPKEPFRYKGETRRLIVDAIRSRYTLMREWYSGIERCRREGLPAMYPVLRDNRTLVTDEYLLFNKFLIAPVMQRAQFERAVYLPQGRWYPLGDTNNAIEGGRTILVPVELQSIPVFVREGSVVVRSEVHRNVEDTLKAPEHFEVYPSSSSKAHGYWFDDLAQEIPVTRELFFDGTGEVQARDFKALQKI